METIAETYSVTLDDGIGRNPLGPMSEYQLWAYLTVRDLQADLTASAVIEKLERTGNATVYFEQKFGL